MQQQSGVDLYQRRIFRASMHFKSYIKGLFNNLLNLPKVMNVICPLNKWKEETQHNKITGERAEPRTLERFHSHKLPLYYTLSIFTMRMSK